MEFLLLAVGLAVIGITAVVIRNRRPRGLDAGVRDFERRRDALAPPSANGRE